MASKSGLAAPKGSVAEEEARREMERLRERRQDSVWYLVVGVALLFAAGFHWGAGVGGVLMVVYGGVRYMEASRRMRHLFDPWDDPEIDAWEEEQLQEIERDGKD